MLYRLRRLTTADFEPAARWGLPHNAGIAGFMKFGII
jgi:hypothetical protein